MKTALVFGSSGLIGGHLLNQLIKDNNYNKIKIFVRSEPENNDPKVEIIKTDFNNLENHKEDIKGDDCFFCIGTTKQNSPDKNEYRRVELDVPKEIAQIAKSNSVNSFIFVSSGYADPKSSGDYLKFKGEVEEELKRLNFSKLGIMRPSFLLGDRKEKRVGEKIGIFVFKLLSPLFLGPLKKMKPIHSTTVAKAHVLSLKNSKVNGRRLLIGSEVKKMLEISKIMQEEFPQFAKKLPKKEMPNFMLKLISYLDSSAKLMVPELGILMQTDTSYAEDLLGIKFKPARDSIKDAGNSVIRLGLI